MASRRIAFVPTGPGTHGIYFSRDGRRIFVSNRDEGSISVLDASSLKPLTKWIIPGGGSPNAIDTTSGKLKARIPVGAGPHGLLVWPQPGDYSLGHTSNIR